MFDIFFMEYGETNAIENYQQLEKFCQPKKIGNITGIHRAHMTCAMMSDTSHYFVVDADNWVYDSFSFELNFIPSDNTTYVWRCRNPVNQLVYGYGAIKLFPVTILNNFSNSSLDVTTSVSTNYQIIDVLASETRFNTSPFDAYRSGFREACKLSSNILKNQNDLETISRLDIWTTIGAEQPFGEYCIKGAKDGKEHGINNINNLSALQKINDWNWLKEKFIQ